MIEYRTAEYWEAVCEVKGCCSQAINRITKARAITEAKRLGWVFAGHGQCYCPDHKEEYWKEEEKEING